MYFIYFITLQWNSTIVGELYVELYEELYEKKLELYEELYSEY